MQRFGGCRPLADYYEETGRPERPTAYSVTGADIRPCPECEVPAGLSCRWPDGRPRKSPHWSRWHPREVA
ncbi:zinc finger domain-containing protein [Mycobacteroides abscessus]